MEVTEENSYFIMKNYIRAEKYFKCHESITYTTVAEYQFLDNIIPIVKRWDGPVSVAIYAPGSDFLATLNAIFYLRNCSDVKQKVSERVTFHLFFDKIDARIENVLTFYEIYEPSLKCADAEKVLNFKANNTFRALNKLKFPINLGRNIARSAAMTHFVMAVDIELYPSPKLVERFLAMIDRDTDGKLLTEKK